MPPIPFEQALYQRPDRESPRLLARSPGFDNAWLPDAEQLVLGFGDRPHGWRCPLAVFGQPLTKAHIAIVRVIEEKDFAGLRFHFLVVERKLYDGWIRDPFLLAEKIEPTWDAMDTLPAVILPEAAFSPRTLEQVDAVLKRVKAGALKEGEDPEAPDFERTIENSESPAMLGGAQILVDGGRVIFERPNGDLRLAAGLWLLLPEMTRARLWPTSFAFSQELEFDLLIVPRVDDAMLESYTTEEQAADYPAGAYEFALQHAVETKDQNALDAVFNKRDGRQTIRLAVTILVLVSAVVLMSRWLDLGSAPPRQPLPNEQAVAAAGIVAVGDPWAALGMIVHGKHIWKAKEKARDAK